MRGGGVGGVAGIGRRESGKGGQKLENGLDMKCPLQASMLNTLFPAMVLFQGGLTT